MARSSPAPLKHPATGELAEHFARLLQLAQDLPDAEESRSYGTPSIKVKGKLIGRLRTEAEGAFAMQCDFPERQMLLQAAPEAFFVTDHYEPYPMVLVRLDQVRWDAMPQLLEAAYRLVAPKTQLKALDARPD